MTALFFHWCLPWKIKNLSAWIFPNFPWPYYSPVLCPALLWPDNVSSRRHQSVGVTDIVLGWVIDRHHTWIILSNIHRDYKNTTDNYSLKNDDMNSWPPPLLKFVILDWELEMMILTRPPPSFLHDVILFPVFLWIPPKVKVKVKPKKFRNSMILSELPDDLW